MKRANLLRRFVVLAFALVTLGGVFALPAGAATVATAHPAFPSGVMIAGSANNGPVHKVWTSSLPAAECKALLKTSPQASCTTTVTIDVQIVSGPQKPPPGAQVAAKAPAATDSSYWTYEIGTITSHRGIWSGTLREEVDYHDNCPNAECTHQGAVWNQWIDTSGYSCVGCNISGITRGVIGNGSADLNGWEDFDVSCALTIAGSNVGCNAGHGNRLYFNADDGAWRGFSY